MTTVNHLNDRDNLDKLYLSKEFMGRFLSDNRLIGVNRFKILQSALLIAIRANENPSPKF